MSQVTIYAYELASNDLVKVTTDTLGRFLFEGLPAGMYKLVAFKPGFLPAVELLLRRRPHDHQFVELELRPQEPEEKRVEVESDFWTVRGRVPMDVLRQIDALETQPGPTVADMGLSIDSSALFEAEMHAFSGVESFGPGFGNAQLTAAELGLRAAVGTMGVGIDGTFQQLSPGSSQSSVDGQVKSVAVRLDPSADQQLRLATSNNRLVTQQAVPVDLDRYQVDWSGRTGTGSTRVSASYVQETNFLLGSSLRPLDFSGSSQTWGLEGSYSGRLSDRTSLEAGLVYRQRSLTGFETPDELLGLFTSAGSQIQPRVFLEYGLYSSVRGDGSLSLVPHGGVVVRLSDTWSAEAGISRRIEQEGDFDLPLGHQSAFYSDSTSCREVGQACYEITFARTDGEEALAIGALHREFSETLRLYFSPDFFDRLESVFMVEGDHLPEIQVSLVRRISPEVLTKLESSFASGGGGVFHATNHASYENEVSYLVTSLDTRFQKTATGVFVAFHHLEQAFHPVERDVESPVGVELQRLQLMLTQDLNVLADLTSKWAVNLNMELSRGATPYTLTADDQTYRKLTGGFSVSF